MKQFLKYSLIGIVSNGTGYVLYLILTSLSLEPKVAMTLVYLTGATIGFIGNRQWTFRHTGKISSSLAKYTLVHSFGYLLNYSILHVFVDRMGYPHQIVQAIAIIIVAVFLFVTFKIIVFRNESGNF
jgi:putative flippase GtrA